VKRLLIGLAMLAGLAPLVAPFVALAAPPSSAKATYDVYFNSIPAGTEQEIFTHANGKYRIESTTTPNSVATLFIKYRVVRVATGSVTTNGLRPEFYEEKRVSPDGKVLESASASFDWSQRRLTLAHGDRTEQFALEPGTLDWSTLFFQFLFKAPDDNAMKVTLTNGKRVQSYQYRFAGNASLSTPAGQFEVAHYARQSGKDEPRVDIWLARNKSNILVRLKQLEHGRQVEQHLVGLEFN
jgi:hypothetical protein